MALISPDDLDYHYLLLGLPPREQGRGSTVSEIQQAYRRKVEELEIVKNLRTPAAVRANFQRIYSAFLALKKAASYASLDAARRRSCEESKGEAADAGANADAAMEVDTRNVTTEDHIVTPAGDMAMEDIAMRETDDFLAGLERALGGMKLF